VCLDRVISRLYVRVYAVELLCIELKYL